MSSTSRKFPKISVVTPSFNQAEFLERTIRSVLDQDYPNIEYIIIDGGSTDGSVDIIRKYADRLAYWVSEPDRGQSHAINKGLARATGEWVCWQNSDDVFYPDVFPRLASQAQLTPDAELVIGNMVLIDRNDRVIRDIKYVKPIYSALLAEGMVLANQASFWRRECHAQLGFLDERLDCCFDYEWFLRLLKSDCLAVHVNATWGALRMHEDTKTSNRQQVFNDEYRKILEGREVTWWSKRFHQMRRLALMVVMGEFRYVLRGAFRRLQRIK